MNTPTANDEINRSITETQADYDDRQFEHWLTQFEVSKGRCYKNEEFAMKDAWFAGITYARQSLNVSDQIPAALDSANTTDGSSRLSASVLFGPFVAAKALCEELLAEPGCPPWKVDALRTAVNAVNQIMMMSPGEIHLNSCNIREAISNQRGKCLCQIAFDSIPLSR